MKSGRKKKMIVLIIVLAAIVFVIWQNNCKTVTRSEFKNLRIPAEFDGLTIAHISDLHNKSFGRNQSRLLERLADISPDIIVVTGDLIDRRKYNLDIAMDFIEGALNIAPVFYVSGNHEAWSGEFSLIKERLEQAGVTVLDDAGYELFRQNSSILLLGLSDPDFLTNSYLQGTDTSVMENQLSKWDQYNKFKILLSHRPELFDLYAVHNMDLIFAGHAHGGLFRLPYIGGLVGQDQGLFPKYTSGFHVKDNSAMYVSRGLGNSIIPVRVFNRPEIIVVTLRSEKP